MNSYLHNLKNSSHKRTWGVLVFALLLLSIPLTLTLTQQSQDVRQRASGPTKNSCDNLTLNECLGLRNICSWSSSENKCVSKAENNINSSTYSISGQINTGNSLYLGDNGQAIIYLYGPVNKITKTTNSNYAFSGLPAGNYEVRLKIPSNYKATNGTCNDSSCTDKVSLSTNIGPSISTLNFQIAKE